MTTVGIIHGIEYRPDGSEGMAWPLAGGEWAPTDAYRFVYTYEADPADTDLNIVFRQNNAVDGTEINVKAGFRSLSVGDIIAIDGAWNAVRPVGFYRLTADEIVTVYDRLDVTAVAKVLS